MARAVERHAERTGMQLPLTTAAATPVAAAPLTEPPQMSPVDVTDIAIFLAGLTEIVNSLNAKRAKLLSLRFFMES
jgi:hypothetical protein